MARIQLRVIRRQHIVSQLISNIAEYEDIGTSRFGIVEGIAAIATQNGHFSNRPHSDSRQHAVAFDVIRCFDLLHKGLQPDRYWTTTDSAHIRTYSFVNKRHDLKTTQRIGQHNLLAFLNPNSIELGAIN